MPKGVLYSPAWHERSLLQQEAAQTQPAIFNCAPRSTKQKQQECLQPTAVEGCLSEPAAELESDSTAPDAVQAIWQECRERILASDLDHLVLDEVGLAVDLGYLDGEEVLSTLQQRPGSMDVILTGSSIPSLLIGMADQVTQLRRGF